MAKRVFNFSAGPAVLPVSLLEEARENLLSMGDTGIGMLEHSHRGKAFLAVYEEAEALCRDVAGIPDDYRVLFLQGGASTQFFMVPMNYLAPKMTADYLITGLWSKKALTEAQRFGNVHVACSSEDRNFCYIPKSRDYSLDASYVHYTSNNTIYGTQFSAVPECLEGGTLVCDSSSDIFSRPIDVTKFGIIYAGAQKNLGISGVTLVIIRTDLIDQGSVNLPAMLQFRTHAANDSAFNTPPTFAIYIMCLMFKWINQQGGLAVMEQRNRQKAETLYQYLDQSELFQSVVDTDSRSLMNVTFVTGKAELDAKFIQLAEQSGLVGLKGHSNVGGMRASLYNAFCMKGVEDLIKIMRQFELEYCTE